MLRVAIIALIFVAFVGGALYVAAPVIRLALS